MRFGIKTAPQHTTWAAMLDVWRAADDIEVFESAWNFDHFYPIFSDSDGPCLEAWTMLAAMAQATRRIRMFSPSVPIIALTAHAMPDDQPKAKEAGCDDYDTKPVELTRLLGKMEALLRKSSNPAGATPPMENPQNLSSGETSPRS